MGFLGPKLGIIRRSHIQCPLFEQKEAHKEAIFGGGGGEVLELEQGGPWRRFTENEQEVKQKEAGGEGAGGEAGGGVR